jgi:hypothetical protein
MPRHRWLFAAIWLAFLLHGALYCQLIPIWEGYDEWGHYAFVEHLRLHRALPVTSDSISEEIRISVQSAPIRHEASDPMTNYEAQQPPLYYLALALPNRLWLGVDIQTRVHRLRWFSVLIASLAIPCAYLAALELFYSRALALMVCALIASMPALMIDIARVGNESLAIALASWIVLLLLRKNTPALGFAFGLALLTKAYFLALAPVLIFRRRFSSLAIAIGIGGWWYWRSYRMTGTLTGEIMDVVSSKLGFAARLSAIGKVRWLAVLDAALWTHIWTGAWSFLTVRSWMYRVFELIFAIVAIMLVGALVRRPYGQCKRKLVLLSTLEAAFAAAIAYHALSIFLGKNLSFAPGWYFYVLIVAEALLLASGLLILVGRRRILPAMGSLIALFLALDVYTAIFVLARFYRR